MIFEIRDGRAEPVLDEWAPGELELESYLIAKVESDSNARLLDAKVFGEPLLLLENQVHTKQGKRADIIALDQFGNGVFIELKKRAGKQGVETQALQYLANYANVRGEQFLARFRERRLAIDGFLGDYDIHTLNQKSRIMLVARSFDDSVFSMGEWLASQGVAFRCIAYTPFKAGDRTMLSFSVRFDRSKDPIYQLNWEPRAAEYFWHNIGSSPISHQDDGSNGLNTWWKHHRSEGMISAGFANEPGDAGDKILNSYAIRDIILAYASGYGAVGWGILESPLYQLVDRAYDSFTAEGEHRHRLQGIRWKASANLVEEAITPKELKDKFGLNHPIQTKSKIQRQKAEGVIKEMNRRFETA